MTKDVKYIIFYGILLGFFLTMLGIYGIAKLAGPGTLIAPGLADPWINGLCGLGGIIICIAGIYKRINKHKP